jgi:hypothetical protein
MIPDARTIDDAFITFRYARNIVEGVGFVYNPDARVLGTTTPLFTLAMAAIGAVLRTGDFPHYAVVISALADACTVGLLWLLVRHVTDNRWLAALCGFLYAIAPVSVTFAIGGMETSVNILWIVLAAWLYVTDRPIALGVVAGLGILTRVDAVLWIAPLFAHQWFLKWRSQRGTKWLTRIPWRTWLATLITITPWVLFSILYFGSPLPNTVGAKTLAYIVEPYSALIFFIQRYGTPFFESESFDGGQVMVFAFAYLFLNISGILSTARRVPRLLPLLIYPWVYLGVFAVANPLMFRWYIAPPLPALILGIILGAGAILNLLPSRIRMVGLALIGLLWIGLSLNGWTATPDHGPNRPAPKMAWHQIELYYQQIGTLLRERYGITSTTKVASADIGVIGYFSRATIIDTVGLVTPALTRYYPFDPAIKVEGQNYAIPPRLILDTAPAYFVTMEAFVRNGLALDPAFQAAYGEPVERIPTGFYGTDMRLYQRREGR